MERSKVIPGWYQRLISHQSGRPGWHMSFKQYCTENETRMKILYPFLPHEQLKGKLLARWKKSHPQEGDKLARTGMKKQKKFFKPSVVTFCRPPRLEKRERTVSTKTADEPVDWLRPTHASKFGKSDAKTYTGRAFVLSPKVPEVIFEPPNLEKSILKRNGSAGVTTSGEKRQPASQVSFTLTDQRSPLLYSPPTPFVLSPASAVDCTEDDDRSPQQNTLSESPFQEVPEMIRQTSNPKPLNPPHKIKDTSRHTIDSIDQRKGRQGAVLEKQDQRKIKPSPKSTPMRKTKARLNKMKTPNKSPRRRKGSSCPSEPSLTSSQYIEPPKFGPVVTDSPDQRDKRFCLFEDEWVKPKSLEKRPVVSHCLTATKKAGKATRKTGKAKAGKKFFSWSPALGCSQHTPKVNKSKKSLFSQEKPETYQKQKQNRCVSKCMNKRQLTPRKSPRILHQRKTKRSSTDADSVMAEREKRHHSSQSAASKEQGNGARRKSPRIKAFTNRKQEHDNTFFGQQRNLSSADLDVSSNDMVDSNAKHTEVTADVHLDQIFTQSDQTNSPTKAVLHCDERKTSRVRTQATGRSSPKMPAGFDGPVANTRRSSLKQSDDGQTNDKAFLLAPDILPLDCELPDEDTTEETDILRRILFQLKNTATSSHSVARSSPAQSRTTEVSEMSAKDPASGAPSPPSDTGPMDDLGLFASRTLPAEKALTTVNNGRAPYRRRNNTLCNLFEESGPDAPLPSKARRYIRSDTCPEEPDFSTLFSADVFF